MMVCFLYLSILYIFSFSFFFFYSLSLKAVLGLSRRTSFFHQKKQSTFLYIFSTFLVAGITLGMSGVDRPADKEMVGKWIHEILPTTVPFAIHNDATAALSSGM